MDDEKGKTRGRSHARSESPPLRSVSPRRVSTRLFKIVTSDPHSEVTPSLGHHSTSHPDVSFQEGGGFTVRTKSSRPLSTTELEDDYQRRLSSWKQHGSRGNEPVKQKSKEMVIHQGDLEYHPPGGIHSSYNPKLDDSIGGSYLRVKNTTGEGPREQRYGRYGPFANTETFDHQEIRRPKDRGIAEKEPPPRSDSPPPSPRTARRAVERLYREPDQVLSELSQGNTYRQIAQLPPDPPMQPEPQGGGIFDTKGPFAAGLRKGFGGKDGLF